MAPATDDTDLPESDVSERHRIADARIGQVVAGSYRIARYIGSGGSSHVFQAEHLRLGTGFAVKLLRADLDRGRRAAQRFRREARAVARLRSEHVVRVIDCGELEDNTPYLVMELLEGEDLRGLLNRETALPARRAVHLICEACQGLAEVHQSGLVHRDVKPENLFLCRRSSGEDWCKVLDFGVAKMEASIATAQGAIVGTVRYMAPEQLADGASVSAATDIYALGAILYECLSGRPAHVGEAIQEVMFSVMHKEPTPLSTLRPTLPQALIDVVEHCLAKQASERPQHVTDLARLLSAAIGLEDQPSKREATLAEDAVAAPASEVAGASRRSKPSLALALALALGALGGVAGAWLALRAPHPIAPVAASSTAMAASAAPTLSAPTPARQTDTAASPTVLPSAPSANAGDRAPTAPPRQRIRVSGPAGTQAASGPAASAHPPAAPRGVSVGSFDSANPYGE